jgi:hypothetical protein
MKQIIFQLIFIASLLSIFYSCEFEPSSENFIDLARPDTTRQISVDLSPFERQYIFTKFANVTYDLNTFGLKIYNVEFFVGDQSIHQGTEAIGFFGFNPGLYGRGMKVLTMQITTSSSTGSLADRLGIEALVFQQNWNIILDGEAPNPVEIKKIYNDKGVLKLEWEEYTRINFERYIVCRKFGKIGDQAETHLIAEFTDRKQTTFSDFSYIGGSSTYWVVVEGSEQSSIGTKKEINYPEPRLDTLWMRSDSASFIWRRNQFYNAVKKMEISIPESYSKPPAVLFSSTNVNDTTVTINHLRFGNTLKLTLSAFAKAQVNLFDDKQIQKSELILNIGEKCPKWNKLLGSFTENYLYLWNGERISKIDMDTKKELSSVNNKYFYDWFISPYDGALYTHNPNLTRYNKNNLADQQTYSSYDFGFHTFWTTTSISSDNRIAGPVGFYVGYYDLTENRLIFTENENNIDWCQFSPDGRYAFKANNQGYAGKVVLLIYEVTDTGMRKIGQTPEGNYSKTIWIPGYEHTIMLLNGYEDEHPWGTEENTVTLFNAQTLTSELSFKVEVGHLTNVDSYTRQVAVWDENPRSDEKRKLYVYNFETGKLVTEINLTPSIEHLSIFRSKVFSSNGYYLDYSN